MRRRVITSGGRAVEAGNAARFMAALYSYGLPPPVQEYRFAAELCGGTGRGLRGRLAEAGLHDWRLDFAWPDKRLAVEFHGGLWAVARGKRSRHSGGRGQLGDMEKLNAAQLSGWVVLQYQTGDIVGAIAGVEKFMCKA